jgi:hypothetical protein
MTMMTIFLVSPPLLSSQPDYDEIDENGTYKAFSSTRPSKEKLLSTDKKYGE